MLHFKTLLYKLCVDEKHVNTRQAKTGLKKEKVSIMYPKVSKGADTINETVV